MYFNQYLKLCREQSILTQEKLVHALYSYDIDNFGGLDTSTLSKWERNVTQPIVKKQVSIIKFFQESTALALPFWDQFSIHKTEELICKAGMHNLLGKNKRLVMNFPSTMINEADIDISALRNFKRMDVLLDINMDIHKETNSLYSQISIEQFRDWALHPSNLFLACEYKHTFSGLFFSLRLKPDIFDKLMTFQIKKSDITIHDFASFDEMGCHYLLSFYALSETFASLLMIRYYAHLIANQKYIKDIGVETTVSEVKKVVSNMNLKYISSLKTNEAEIEAYRESLFNVLASDKFVKMILSNHDCPEG